MEIINESIIVELYDVIAAIEMQFKVNACDPSRAMVSALIETGKRHKYDSVYNRLQEEYRG